MLESVSSNATVAKIRALHGRMLTGENYSEMLARRSVPEIAEYLSATVRFKDVLKDIDPMTVHRGFLETLLEKENFETYIRLCKFQQLDKLPFFDFLISRSEIGCLLMLINSINSGLDRSSVMRFWAGPPSSPCKKRRGATSKLRGSTSRAAEASLQGREKRNSPRISLMNAWSTPTRVSPTWGTVNSSSRLALPWRGGKRCSSAPPPTLKVSATGATGAKPC